MNLELTTNDLALIEAGLVALPYKDVAELMDNLREQIKEQVNHNKHKEHI
jgi:hypothetical protein